ncbi:hypothetical protein SLH46_12015 [Draconibacterium sp. IB214405]|uniref:hypothetical protein n=1 Tax=Draconibacterium sp. IB214405 TaxID=3097352 RepID=UPI002A16DE70|nr:hypothetical protein [Draconibacterium sp. IB214405]MDX8339915.1 hypothetical protein [Draconibacterium sp. IB214405]
MISFGIKYWFVLLIAIVLVAVGISLLLYYKNKANKELSKMQRNLLFSLRFLSFFLIAFLLLSPFIRSLKKIIQNPVIITAWDNSGSVIAYSDSLQLANYLSEKKASLEQELGAEFDMVNYTFGEQAETNETMLFTDKGSNYSDLISTIANNHFNQNIGALVLAGDGIYNQGKNPLNMLDQVNFPIYTIGFGDTTVVADARVQSIRVNRTAFSGNKFPVEVDLLFSKLKNTPLKLSLLNAGEELQSVMITPANDNFFETKEFILEAGSAGLKHYSVQIQTATNERNTKNNSARFVINVLENKQKILIISNGSHPDIGAIKNTLDQQKTYDVSIFTDEPYPADLSEYNLLVLNQLPSSGKSMAEVLEKAKNTRLPILFIIGNQTFLPQLNTINQGARIESLAGSGEEAQPVFNANYATFNLSKELLEIIPQLPPIQVPFANYELNPEFSSLLTQKLKGISTSKPLIATGKLEGQKRGFIFGEGIWRWRLFDYYQNQSHEHFNELINQLIQYLALRENEDNFIVEFNPVYTEVDDVILTAEVYNDAFEQIGSEEVNIKIKNDNDEEYNLTFDVRDKNYYLNAGHLPLGDYTFEAEVTIGNETFNETGSFTVVPVNIENVVTQANHTLLYQLASVSGGKFYLPNQTEELVSELKQTNKLKATSYFQEMVNEIINLRWIFLVLVVLLSTEWFLRKYWGIY